MTVQRRTARRQAARRRAFLAACAMGAFVCGVTAGSPGATTAVPDVVVVVGTAPKQAFASIAVADGRGQVTRRYLIGEARSLALSPDGRSLAFTTVGSHVTNEVRLLNLQNGRARLLANARRGREPAFFGQLAWAPGGATIAATRGAEITRGTIELLDARSGAVRRSFDVTARTDSRLAWARDGRTIVFAAGGSLSTTPALRRLTVSTGRVVSTGVRGLDPALGAGGALAFAAPDGVYMRSGSKSTRVPGTRRGDRSPAWLRDGTLLLERPVSPCPRGYFGQVCSHVLVMPTGSGPSHRLVEMLARTPSAR